MKTMNRPVVSEAIALSYRALVIFSLCLVIFFTYSGLHTPMGWVGFVAGAVSLLVGIVMLVILRSLYLTRYILTDQELLIRTTRLIGGEKKIPLETIESVERTLIPFGIRLLGASFHGGYYKIPGLGRAFLAITNFKDGLLLRTSKGNFIITPSLPEDFQRHLEPVQSG